LYGAKVSEENQGALGMIAIVMQFCCFFAICVSALGFK